MKYTKENIKPYCKDAYTVMTVIRRMGLKSGSNTRLYNLIKEILIESGSYKGRSFRKNDSTPRKSNEQFFTNGDSKRSTWAVRNALFDRGLKEKKCECCGREIWQSKPIPLEVHHKDGNKYNNELDNLEILCPNCHYFTDTYKIKNIKPV